MLSKKEFFKIKLVLVLGYNGLGFHGMQKNQGVRTIEETLESALHEGGFISDLNFNNLKKIKWSRAARTDKGVHAVANFVNCKMNITNKFLSSDQSDAPEGTAEESKALDKEQDKRNIDWKKVINAINGHLPNDIKIHTIKRITKSFDVKQSARSRIYEYLSPVKLFIKESEQADSDQEAKTLERLKTLCSKFKGTHNFHNYTKAMKATDPRSNRYIMRFECDYVDYPEGKYIKFLIQGQSFIYHQIRKMIGIMCQVIQLGLNDQFIDNSFFNNAVNIWLAPPQGLLLDRVTFDGYNKKKDIPEPLEFNPVEEQDLQEFKEKVIYPVVINAELTDKSFSGWLATMLDPANNKIVESSDDEMDEEEGDQKGKGKKGKKKGEDSDDD